MNKKIVIVGGGFAGVQAAVRLANQIGFQVQLISPLSIFEYHAALYRSATGRSPLEVAIPLEKFFEYAKNIEVVQDKIIKIDQDKKQIEGKFGKKYSYDELLLGVGNVTGYFHIPGVEKYSFGVKSVEQALKLKEHLHKNLSEKKYEHAYVVVGAGPTGVELAAEMASYLKFVAKRHKVPTDKFTIYLVEAGPKVLGMLPKKFTDKIEKRIKALGIKLYLNTAVESETKEYVNLPGEKIKSRTVIWTAGVQPNPLFAENDIKMTKRGRVEVNEYLQSSSHVYVMGDSAATKYTGMAQTAIHDAKFVATNLIRERNKKQPLKYRPKRPDYAIPVGARWAAVKKGKKNYFGFMGWILRRLTDLKLYRQFLPIDKALTTWRYGYEKYEVCPECSR
ncbi:NAD(P)/FAD-dependent oxidoreductase [Candidatus Saccharibacteria bacterium]|nr:NAD(P)/FAD-dependent oxidoreductase [Candidatus Saccharibacteria bacterium]